MKIQRFEGKDSQEALHLAQMALGPDAVVLQTRRIPASGVLGLVGSSRVEVLAAVDNPRPAPSASAPAPVQASRPAVSYVGTATLPAAREAFSPAAGIQPGSIPVPAPAQSAGAAANAEPWQAELAALRGELTRLRWQMGQNGAVAEAPAARAEQAPQPTEGLASAIAPRLFSAPAPAEAPPGRESAPAARRAPEREELARRVRPDLVSRTIEFRAGCTAIALVGSTGAGKTTTLAKLAAAAVHGEQRRVAFITVDTYRIAAVEQLETYARLLEVPLSVAYSADDLRLLRERYSGYDLVFIDTVGRAPSNGRQMDELAGLMFAARPDETHLVMDARASYATLTSVLTGFRALRPSHLVLSKLDETPCLEDALVAALDAELPLSYVTTGQRVPEDLAAADPEELARLLLGGR